MMMVHAFADKLSFETAIKRAGGKPQRAGPGQTSSHTRKCLGKDQQGGVSGLAPLEVRNIVCSTRRMCATPPKQILPRAPTVNFPTVTPNTTFTPAPTTTLPAAPPPAAHGSFTEMLQNWQPMDDMPSLPGCQTLRGAPSNHQNQNIAPK
ncbi:uncharacterized protein LOC128606840 isoform X3 [Ictalurus furcatus]|uniref:uncharacterized protein LOC128606840 isoform X3 n=1 Tax=Ictalurus furcatus TaxID=66913 RepID=UPI00234FB788|nr:uncharacterized protein LOC128606840 isoform X3 [Ictalurus furcatus]XP_053479296.1 uncharacterized protein LOC128606840 isoform X3 [Ictalurus furcatus]